MERDLLMEMTHCGGTEDDEETDPKRGPLEGDRFVGFFFAFFCVLCLLSLFLYTVLFKSDDAEEGEEESYEAIPFQRAALWIGFFIILCAAAMKHLHQ